jgi:hypothetical protein
MLKTLTFVAALAVAAAATAQEKKITTADFAGTWNIDVMSHQVALVIEPQDGTKVTGTMMMMGRDVPLKGDLDGRTITFVGVKPGGDVHGDLHGQPASGASHVGNQNPTANAKPIVVTLLEDGTLSGEMMTSGGPVKWTGEKLKTKKKS